MQLKITVTFLATLLFILSSCRPELMDEDGAVKVNNFRLVPLPDTILEGDYTEPSCLSNIEANYINLDFPEEIKEIEVTENYTTKIVASSSYYNPKYKLTLILPPDSLPMVRRNYSLTNKSNPDTGTCYLYLELNDWTYNEYRPSNGEGTAHFYRKEDGGFRIQICEGRLLREGDNSNNKYHFRGWVEQ